MLVIKLMSKPNVEDRYRHHGEGEKDPKGGYAYAGCELAPKHYKPGGGTRCRVSYGRWTGHDRTTV